MNDNIYIYVLSPIIAAAIGGVGYLVKWYFSRIERQRAEELQERNLRREEIEHSLKELKDEVAAVKKDLNNMQAIILMCEKSDCPSKNRLARYFTDKRIDDAMNDS